MLLAKPAGNTNPARADSDHQQLINSIPASSTAISTMDAAALALGTFGLGMSTASLFKGCTAAFEKLSQSLRTAQPDANEILRRDFRRLVVWAENTGAHRTIGRMSLDYHLREALQVKNTVIGLLEDLKESLEDGIIWNPTYCCSHLVLIICSSNHHLCRNAISGSKHIPPEPSR